METRKICDNVYYVGVDDHSTHLFENLWPLPYGVSYNSYVVTGQKNALIDSCKDGFEDQYLSNVSQIIGQGQTIDYIVVNHMEPDHSGLLPRLLELYPQAKIVASKIAVGMVKGFYHIDDDSKYIIVGGGQTLDLGTVTLKFVSTPMVHWPETMMTYIPERQLLFSGDAFGCFGALNGKLIDDDIADIELYREEMYRYYSNIVGKYGAAVSRALKALADCPLQYICSTHGPVWHQRLAMAVDIYTRLSSYMGEDGVCLIYGSMYGNTGHLAAKIAELLQQSGIDYVKVHEASWDDISYMISDAFRLRGLIIGSPTYSMTLFPPVDSLLKALAVREIKNKTLSIFGTYAWAPAAIKALSDCAEANKWPIASKMSMPMAMTADSELQASQFVQDFIAAYKAAEN